MVGGNVIPFAAEVYRLAELVKGSPINKSLPTDRELLKLIGTTWGRESQLLSPDLQEKLEAHKPVEWGTPDIWAKMFIANCERLPASVSIFNDDTRFENELRIAGEAEGFIPVFVNCREATRLQRLKMRGENSDPNDPDHKSEELPNILRMTVLESNLLPVVWHDEVKDKPNKPWFFSAEEFRSCIKSCSSNAELSAALDWNRSRASELLAFAAQKISERGGRNV